MKPTRQQQKKMIISLLAVQHHAIKYIKSKYKLRQRDIEILAACYQLTKENTFFAIADIEKYMKEGYYHCDVHNTITLLTAEGYIQRISERRQWFKPHKYAVQYKGESVLNEYARMLSKSILPQAQEKVIY
jgi:hypothetical protein